MRATSENPWRRLRLALAVFTVTALAGGGAACAAWRHEHGAMEGMKRAEARLDDARRRQSEHALEARELRRYGRAFREWASIGLIGDGPGEAWTRAVRRAGDRVLSASHRTGTPRVVGREGIVEVLATDMSIELRMRHEAELPEFLSVLAREARGLFTVSGCRLVRSGDAGTSDAVPAPIEASCQLEWQAVRLSGVEPDWLPPAVEGFDNDAGNALPTTGRRRVDEPRGAFGRLFTTAEERARIESAANIRPPAPPPAEKPASATHRDVPTPRPPQWVEVNGLVARAGEPVFIN